MKVKPRGIEIPLMVIMIVLSVFVVGALGLVIYRLGQSGVFRQETTAQTEAVTTRRPALLTTARATEATEAETVTEDAGASKETKTEAVTTAAATETEENTTAAETTAAETKPEETKAPETAAPETKPEKNEKPAKTDATKAEGKDKESKTTTAAAEKDPVALYQKYVKDELVPRFGLAAVNEGKRPADDKGLSSVLIRDFSGSGALEMLVIRLEEYNNGCAMYPVFELYGIKDGKVELLGDRACDFVMSEWNVRLDGNNVYMRSKMENVNGLEEDIRFDQYDFELNRHKVSIVKDSYTIGDVNGPVPTYPDDALWIAEVVNQVDNASLGNDGRVYILSDYTGLRDWVK